MESLENLKNWVIFVLIQFEPKKPKLEPKTEYQGGVSPCKKFYLYI